MNTETKSGSGSRTAGRIMKIYFCDICNESIPLSDINSNRITIEEGKIFCPKCAPKKAKAGDRVPPKVVAALVVLAAVVAALGVAGWLVSEDLKERGDRTETTLAALETRSEQIVGQVGQLQADLKSLREAQAKQGDDHRTALAEIRLKLETLDQRQFNDKQGLAKEIASSLRALQVDHGPRLGTVEEKIQTILVDLKGMQVSQDSLASQFDLLKDLVSSGGPVRPGGGSSTPVAPDPTAGAGEGAPTTSPEDDELNALIAQLQDKDPGTRYSAVVGLGTHSGDKVVKALENTLGDSEDYVRVAVIRNLRKLKSVTSIPVIIDALRDKDYFVRVAARDALRALSSTEMGFDPDASSSDREKKVKGWEDWWEKNRERLVKRG